MASKLCCTGEQDERSDSPELPNVRVSEATPAKLPLLPKRPESQSSRHTSQRSDDLHELHQIFDNVQDDDAGRASPTRAGRQRLNPPSVYSLHSLHKMRSMHSLIRRKFSRDLSKKPSNSHAKTEKTKRQVTSEEPETVVKQPRDGPNQQLNITKEDLKKDLLSDKKPDEGGYDSDAQVLDDIAKNLGKKTTPNKRPSIHSIEWTPSTTSKPTPESSSRGRHTSSQNHDIQPYQIQKPQAATLSARFSQVFSTPNLNLQPDYPKAKDRGLRRSHSASSFELPAPSPLSPISPIRLPSLKTHDQDGVPWSVAMTESLRLSQFPVPPRHITPKPSKSSLRVHMGLRAITKPQSHQVEATARRAETQSNEKQTPATVVEIRVQEPTSASTPRQSASIRGAAPNASASVRGKTLENEAPLEKCNAKHDQAEVDENNPRRSVHLYSMRISHHLRSGSLLSWDNLADAPDLPAPPRPFRDRSVSDISRISQIQKQPSRHERQTSSSGFASSKVPSKWGRVVPNEGREDKSSIYSSRPQSPPDSFGGSMNNLSQSGTRNDASNKVSEDLARRSGSGSYPSENDETPRPIPRHGLTNLREALRMPTPNLPSKDAPQLARNNSVASTKVSKFREEFSPSPPKKRITASESIMRFLNPKRNSMRSQSEASLKSIAAQADVDGSLETPRAATHRERRLSKSMMSLQAEQDALGKDVQASPMWERALKNYQDEKASMFLPKNKELAVQSTPFRERSGSVARSRHSDEAEVSSSRHLNPAKRFSAPLLSPPALGEFGPEYPPTLFTRRTALVARDPEDVSPGQEVQIQFAKQDDTAKDTVGAWGKYPSHTRPERTLSAGHLDSVETRDFALEAAIKFAMGKGSDMDDSIDPTSRVPSPPLLPGEKKRKKKLGNQRMAKSHSMTFGKAFLKNYTRIFRSSSIEFQKHGHGHRSSITTGGTLDYPELEIRPGVWNRGIAEERSGEHSGSNLALHLAREEHGPGDRKGKGKLKDEDSAAKLRPFHGGRHTSMARLDGAADKDHTNDSARVWSVYYETCIPSFPRPSTEIDFTPEEFGTATRQSFESKRASMHSRTLPARLIKHSRNASRLSRASARPSFVSGDLEDGGLEERSIVSVRRSTMDLVTMYQKQEDVERERVLGLMRGESREDRDRLSPL